MQTGNGRRTFQYTIPFTVWTSFSECSEGTGLGGSSLEGIFVEMDRGGGGVLTQGKLRKSCAYSQYSNLHAHLYRLISLSFLPFRVCSKKVDTDKIVQSEFTSEHLMSKWRRIDVDATSSGRIDFNTTSFHAMCTLSLFMHNMGEMDGNHLYH